MKTYKNMITLNVSKLKRIIKDSNLTKTAINTAINFSNNYIQSCLKSEKINISAYKKLCDFLNVNYNYLTGYYDWLRVKDWLRVNDIIEDTNIVTSNNTSKKTLKKVFLESDIKSSKLPSKSDFIPGECTKEQFEHLMNAINTTSPHFMSIKELEGNVDLSKYSTAHIINTDGTISEMLLVNKDEFLDINRKLVMIENKFLKTKELLEKIENIIKEL